MSSPDRSDELDGSPLSDEQARAQVVEPAKQLVKAADLSEVTGSFRFGSCNDQNEPPFRGMVNMRFALPAGVDPTAYLETVERAMVNNGWVLGPPPGKVPHGRVVHQGEMMAIMSQDSGSGLMQIYGECRNLTKQLEQNGTLPERITEELTS